MHYDTMCSLISSRNLKAVELQKSGNYDIKKRLQIV